MDSSRQRRPQVGWTTTRRGEMTLPNFTRRRRQTPQQHHTLPAVFPRSRPDLPPPSTDEPCLQKHRSRTPYSQPHTTDARIPAHQPSSTLPPPQRAQLGIADDGPPRNVSVHHSMPCRHRRYQYQRDGRYQHQTNRQQLEREALMMADSLRRDNQNAVCSRTSTMRSGNETANSTSTGSQGYFTDCESEASKHHQRQPQRRRRYLSQPTSTPPHPACSSTEDRREFRGATRSPSKHGEVGFRDSVAGRNRRGKYPPRSRSCDSTSTGSSPAGIARRSRDDDRPYATWSGSSHRYRSLANFPVDDCSAPGRLDWNLETPHGVLSLRSTRWRERSGEAVCGHWTSSGGWRWSTDVPSLTTRWSCDGYRARTLPVSFRLRCRSSEATAFDETVGLEPIGRGVETLECEQCYLAATAHLRRLSAVGPHTTLPATDVDSIAPRVETTPHRDSRDLSGASRLECVGGVTRSQRDACQNDTEDSATKTVRNTSLLAVDSLPNDRLVSLSSHRYGIAYICANIKTRWRLRVLACYVWPPCGVRLSVCLSHLFQARGKYSTWLTRGQHATRPAYVSVRVLGGQT